MITFKRLQLKPAKSSRNFFYAVLSSLCASLLLLAACGEAATTNPLPAATASAPVAPATTTAPASSTPTVSATTVSATTAPVTATVTPAGAGAATPGGATLPANVPDEIKKAFQTLSADLEKRSNLPPSSFQVTGYTLETFPNSAMGCPDPDMSYLQVLTPGYQIQVEAGGKTYDYRANLAGTRVFLCGPNGRPVPNP